GAFLRGWRTVRRLRTSRGKRRGFAWKSSARGVLRRMKGDSSNPRWIGGEAVSWFRGLSTATTPPPGGLGRVEKGLSGPRKGTRGAEGGAGAHPSLPRFLDLLEVSCWDGGGGGGGGGGLSSLHIFSLPEMEGDRRLPRYGPADLATEAEGAE